MRPNGQARLRCRRQSFVHARGGRDAIDKAAYPDLAEFYYDLAGAFRAEIHALGGGRLPLRAARRSALHILLRSKARLHVHVARR